MINKLEKEIPIVFSVDNNYIPFLCVSIKSLIDNASKRYFYHIYVFHDGVSLANQILIRKMNSEHIKIQFVNVKHRLQSLTKNLHLRDYYSETIYFRLFIPSIFKQYDKVIYLDSDITVVGDISKLYHTNIDNYLVGAVTDAVIPLDTVLQRYVQEYVGLEPKNYFNSGMLLMNVKKFKEEQIEKKFITLLNEYNFNTIAPDQDYLNALCKGRVFYLDSSWNKMMMDKTPCEKIQIVHYNMFLKPWLYHDVPYGEYFWNAAKTTPFYDLLTFYQNSYSDDRKKKDTEGQKTMISTCLRFMEDKNSFKNVLELKEAF